MEISWRGKGRPSEKFGITVKGLDQVIDFLEHTEDALNDFVEELVEDTAFQMMRPGGRISIKTTRDFSPLGGGIPMETGLLKAVFGAVDGKADTGYFVRSKEKERQRKLYGASPNSLVVWEKIGRFQMDMGTTLWYSHIIQQKWDFCGTYLRSYGDKIQEYAQRKTNRFIDKMAKKYGFKTSSDT